MQSEVGTYCCVFLTTKAERRDDVTSFALSHSSVRQEDSRVSGADRSRKGALFGMHATSPTQSRKCLSDGDASLRELAQSPLRPVGHSASELRQPLQAHQKQSKAGLHRKLCARSRSRVHRKQLRFLT